ncbi:E3 ubiquitin-protein ligase FANCL [Eupeodes corollae]|uniref:E3 ubiquitin-protein ligase FANCL n=1 Tax=Eupeodes corollae TaxID=290404 RepID=UPI00249257CA|nr:E3 ubiquitin-protein ligase FANCL [Eupeodes corollae]
MAEVKHIINVRHLTYVPVDTEETLTPNNFLLGSYNGIKLFCDSAEALRKNWIACENFGNHFWKRKQTETLKKLLLKYPGLLQSTEGKSEITGSIRIQNNRYRVRLICPNYPSIKELNLLVYSGISVTVLKSSNFDPSWTVSRAIEEIPNILGESNTVNYEKPFSIFDAQHEILQLKSTSYKIYTNIQCGSIRFTDFNHFKGHYLQLGLDDTNNYTIFDHSLPRGIQWDQLLLSSSSSIKSFLDQFLKFLEELKDFYTNLADIDELCYVVQPPNPNTKDNWRIFKLKDRVFVKMVLDPFTSSPVNLSLYGPTYEVEALRPTLSEGLKNWDTEMDVHANLLRTFELTYFPMAIEGSEDCCNICYCYQLEGHVPFVSCDNRNCSLVYHAICLKEWFTTLTEGKTFLNVSFGACPFCKSKLSTSFTEMLK